jgi:hypothetical protein
VSTLIDAAAQPAGQAGLLDRERIVARAGFNRWLVTACRTSHPSVHRHGLWLFGLLAAAVACDRHRQAGRLPGR